VTKTKHWTVNKQGSVQHKVTAETSNFGLNGEVYDIQPYGDNAGFSVIIRNVVIANGIIREGLTRYDKTDNLMSGEELVQRFEYSLLENIRRLLDIQPVEQQVIIANRV
jgi:hypothetical protein